MRSSVLLAAILTAACTSMPTLSAHGDILIQGSRVHPESITSDAAGNLYAGSMGGTVFRAEAGSGTAEPWIVPSPANGLTSLLGVLTDEPRGLLWVCNNPPFGGPPPPGARSGLRAFDLKVGTLSAVYDFPGEGPFACNDIAVGPQGSTFATDTAGGRIFALAPNGNELTLFAADPELVGIDGIAFADDGKMYINNVRKHTVQRVDRRPDGSYAGVTTLTLSEPVNGPDALRPLRGNRFLQAEGLGNRVTYVDVEGDRAVITPVRTGLDSSPGVTHVGKTGYAVEGKIGYLFDAALRGKDPDPFIIRAFPLPE
jgi:sugar lactone lactonase YvrE